MGATYRCSVALQDGGNLCARSDRVTDYLLQHTYPDRSRLYLDTSGNNLLYLLCMYVCMYGAQPGSPGPMLLLYVCKCK